MSLSEVFIRRPVATTLLTVAVALAGLLAFGLLPVAPLPEVDSPTISVQANIAGASPETMAATVATPLERSLGRIAGITELTSSSTFGATNIILQFDLSRDINGAAREVQAAINAARALLPTTLISQPTYRKINPSDAPILLMALTSDRYSRGEMYDTASTVLAQKISQIDGVGQVVVGGGALPAVRMELNPKQLDSYGIDLSTVRKTIANTNANQAKGFVEDGDKRWTITANDQAQTSSDYKPLIVTYRNGAPVRLSDLGEVNDSVEDVRNAGLFADSTDKAGKPAVILIIFRQPGANIIEAVERIKTAMPELQTIIPQEMKISLAGDRSVTIRSSLHEVEITLILSVALVTMVVFLFLRDVRATLIPAVAVPVSIIGTFAVMYLLGFSLNNISLMALTIATGFVVDDAIVVLENISRHIEAGTPRFEAALKGAKEVSFTVLSISISLIAVFIPILLMGGIIGRLFREFAVTLSVAILVSLVVSLTTTPMMCALILRRHDDASHSRAPGLIDRFFAHLISGYRRSLGWVLRHSFIMVMVIVATLALNVFLYVDIPKGFFPSQDTGIIGGGIQADQSISFHAMNLKLRNLADIVQADPAVGTVVASIGGNGGSGGGTGRMYITLKPLSERDATADQVINRLRGKLAVVTGAQLFLQSRQDIHIGGRQSNALYQYTIQADDLKELKDWAPKIQAALTALPQLADVNVDSQNRGLETMVTYDRDKLSQYGLTVTQADQALYDAFGQEQVSTLFKPLNQYHVVMEVALPHTQFPHSLNDIYVITPAGAKIPVSSFASWESANAALSVNHQGQFVASTISFNLAPGIALSDADTAITKAMAELGVPSTIQGSFQGTAKVFQDSLRSLPFLILAAVMAMYIVLGILYESYIHPITILSTLPSAGLGALIALRVTGMEFDMIAFIGVLLLIGIVKKNAIMMIDFAIEAERTEHLSTRDAIFKACLLRFRPIMMTTTAALLGAVPLAIGIGEGSELRRPLGVAIVGGLVVSQALTLYTTPVIYLYFDRFGLWVKRRRSEKHAGDAQASPLPISLPENTAG